MVADRLAALLAFHEEDPADAFVLFALASEYRKRGEREEALNLFENLVRDQPDYVGTYYHLAKLLEELERPDDATSVYTNGIKVAARLGDRHSESELRSALLELEIGD